MSPVVELKFHLSVVIEKKGKWFVSTCPILDVRSQGTTESTAKANLIEALGLFIETCFEQGTLGQVLHEAGFKPIHRTASRREEVDMVAIPFILGSPQQHATTRRRAPQLASAQPH